MRESVVKVASYQSNDCATYMLIFFEHGPASIRDYVLLEIIAETLQESLDDYLQSAGANHFSSYSMRATDLADRHSSNAMLSSYTSGNLRRCLAAN